MFTPKSSDTSRDPETVRRELNISRTNAEVLQRQSFELATIQSPQPVPLTRSSNFQTTFSGIKNVNLKRTNQEKESAAQRARRLENYAYEEKQIVDNNHQKIIHSQIGTIKILLMNGNIPEAFKLLKSAQDLAGKIDEENISNVDQYTPPGVF